MVTDLELVGGAVALDFANTREGIPEPDHLRSAADLVAWAAYAGVIDTATAERLAARTRGRSAERAFERALRLRHAIDATFRPLAAGRRPEPAPLADLAAFEAEAVARGRLVPQPDHPRWAKPGDQRPASGTERFDWSWEGEDLDRILWPVARSAVDLLRSGPLDRLKTCHVCPWLFLDLSRNRSRRWCSMNECGVRDKMRRYRARRATAGR